MPIDEQIQRILSAVEVEPNNISPILDAPAEVWARLVANPDGRWRAMASKLWLWLEWDRKSMYPLVMDTIDHGCTIRDTLGRASQVYFKVVGWEHNAETNVWHRIPPSMLVEGVLEGSEPLSVSLADRTDEERTLYGHVVNGLTTFQALKSITGWPSSTLSKRLSKLVEIGAIVRVEAPNKAVKWTVR